MNFSQPYDRPNYIKFLQDQLLSEGFIKVSQELTLEFKPQYINKAHLIGRDDELGLDVLEIEHESENDPRIGISKDIFRLMANYGTRRILAFVNSKNSKNFRLSLATVDLTLQGNKIKRNYSNPRRYSFFLGPNSKTHTPEQFLIANGRVKNFDDLVNRFSVEVVNREFYNSIAIMFSELVGGERKIGTKLESYKAKLQLPSTRDHVKMEEFAVRLIGRIVFCWFLKKKTSVNMIPLISEELLSSIAVKRNSEYYHSVLEGLFFQALNTPIKERLEEYKAGVYKDIPFLNGGLFEPQEEDFYRINARTGEPVISYSLKIPDKWFLEFYEVLETYNFTIDENTSIDVELSVDPEMLGRIFENLLAEINPETGETARRSTGSYYTPRSVVEYMVDESLKEYLAGKTKISERKLGGLLSYSIDDVELTEEEKHKIVEALDKVKILDPACGSGAFPIGILQKMLLILQKVDAKSTLWFNKMLAKIDNTTIRSTIREKFKDENLDYIRKLGIIQESIYGVDIQTIAVEISKLRCFLTLIVDEEIDDKKENRGIFPLPNLEFKFIAANTLIGLPAKDNRAETDFFDIDDEVTELKMLRDEYFRSFGKQKEEVEQKFVQKQNDMANQFFSRQSKDKAILKLADWNPFANEKSDWFDPDWMFGIKDGFDIIIGNPPYITMALGKGQNYFSKEEIAEYKILYKEVFEYKGNTYALFIKKGLDILSASGCISFIVPFSLLLNATFMKLRHHILTNSIINYILCIRERVFETAETGGNVVFQFKKKSAKSDHFIKVAELANQIDFNRLDYQLISQDIYQKHPLRNFVLNSILININEKIKNHASELGNIATFYNGIKTGDNNRFLSDRKVNSQYKKIIRGRDITQYKITWGGKYVLFDKDLLWSNTKEEYLCKVPKIVIRQTGDSLIAALDTDGYMNMDTTHIIFDTKFNIKVILAIINSKFMNWYFQQMVSEVAKAFAEVKIIHLKKLPIIEPNEQIKKELISLVDRLLLLDGQQLSFERTCYNIDSLIYRLYKLTYNEILDIDANFANYFSCNDYENSKLLKV